MLPDSSRPRTAPPSILTTVTFRHFDNSIQPSRSLLNLRPRYFHQYTGFLTRYTQPKCRTDNSPATCKSNSKPAYAYLHEPPISSDIIYTRLIAFSRTVSSEAGAPRSPEGSEARPAAKEADPGPIEEGRHSESVSEGQDVTLQASPRPTDGPDGRHGRAQRSPDPG